MRTEKIARANRDINTISALQAVQHGVAALAIEPMAFGWRRDKLSRDKGPEVTACQPAAGSALLLGETMIGWRVWDVMRAIDWIESRPELDKEPRGLHGYFWWRHLHIVLDRA